MQFGRGGTTSLIEELPQLVNRKEFIQSFVPELISVLGFQEKNPRLILIGGLSCSGKTVLSQQLVNEATDLGLDARWLPLDYWIVSVEKRQANGSVRDRYETQALCQGVRVLLAGQEIYPPIYHTNTRRRIVERRAVPIRPPRHLLVAEGVLALDLAPLREVAWRCLYVQTDPDTRRKRLERFYLGKGLSQVEIEELLRYREIDETPIVEDSRAYADSLISL
jgi:uridine kinase